MGFDIYARDTDGDEVAYLRVHISGFRITREHGFDWFKLIKAEEHNCGVSGCGTSKLVKKADLIEALNVLELHKPNPDTQTYLESWKYRKPVLKRFMDSCINYCTEHKRKTIRIKFG